MLEVGELYSSTPLPTSSLQLFISESSPSTSKSSRFSSVLGKPHYLSGAYLLPTVSSSTLYALISNIVATIYQDIPNSHFATNNSITNQTYHQSLPGT
ncbi:hypothetical protein BLNAU_8322 [Blattamonas nauphoetae]|uniref:Uncharacterized protein n=1 Tax=Blattamonas nauphoetae TaxID=2049346 RepID=A0ABQ9XYW2_9EUKA|nr:hypothetical protein BLNAU_8322 [Blattamonas nauphoetae]